MAGEVPRVLLKRGLRGIRDYCDFLSRALTHERILRHEGRYVINSFIPPVPSEGLRKCLRSQVNNYVLRDAENTVPVAAVVAVRRGGADHVFNSINQLFLISQMIVPGSSYWNMGFGREKGEVEKDEEGIRTMKVLGQNMAWLLKKLHD